LQTSAGTLTKLMRTVKTNYLLLSIPALVMALWSVISMIQNQVDIPHHLDYIIRWHEGEPEAKMYSLYFHLVNLFSFFTFNRTWMEAVAVVLLTSMVIFKFMITEKMIIRYSHFQEIQASGLFKFLFNASLLTLFLCLSQNLIYKFSATMALGYIPVNTWHNSTTITLVPVALLLFFKSFDFIMEEHPHFFGKKDFILLLLTVLSVLIKPSFFFVFVIAFPLFFLINRKLTKGLFSVALICLAGLATMMAIRQYVYSGDESQVVIKPFEAWKTWSDNIPLSFLASEAFPIAVFLLYPRIAFNDKLIQYAWLSFFAGMIIYILLNETGARAIHGNFSWQTIICNYILFLCSLIFLLKQKAGLKKDIALTFLLLHVAAGIVFILKLPFFGPR
jgi:hypothetical protein